MHEHWIVWPPKPASCGRSRCVYKERGWRTWKEWVFFHREQSLGHDLLFHAQGGKEREKEKERAGCQPPLSLWLCRSQKSQAVWKQKYLAFKMKQFWNIMPSSLVENTTHSLKHLVPLSPTLQMMSARSQAGLLREKYQLNAVTLSPMDFKAMDSSF